MAGRASSVGLPNGVDIAYLEQGPNEGTPVLLLPGLGDSWRSFAPVLRSLPDTVRALALSQRGHGDSSKPLHEYRIVDFVEDVAAFLDVLAIDMAVVVGHSSHGLVSERFAIDHRDRTRGLVLIGTPVTLRGHQKAQEMFEGTISHLTDPLEASFVRDFTAAAVTRPLPTGFLEEMHDETHKVPARVFKELFEDLLRTDLSPELDRIQAPTLLVWGDRDEIAAREDQETLARAIPRARLVVYPNTGHSPHWEEPARFAADLVAFTRSLDPV